MNNVDEIKSILKSVLIKENLIDFSIKKLGNSEKGDGYIGDILFVYLSGQAQDGTLKDYNLVLKCGKKSQVLRDTIPVRESFENEILLYEKVFPMYRDFQLEKKVDVMFNSFLKCYGTILSDKMEIIALEDMKMMGYSLCDSKKPLTNSHIELIIKEYGKLHGISAAMEDQYPEKFTQLKDEFRDTWGEFANNTDAEKFFSTLIDDACKLIRDDVDHSVIEKLQNLKNQISYIMKELLYDRRYFSVINHGDGWNNNFMFKYKGSNTENPVNVAILDWQIAKYANPVVDLSYFIYACISKEGLDIFDDILKLYYDSFSNIVKNLGSNPDEIYPYSQFLEDWKVFAKFGIITAFMILKIALTDQDEVKDITECIEKGLTMYDTFTYEIKDNITLKNRLLYLMDHVTERNLI